MRDEVERLSQNLQLEYTILCDDVRLEAGNKLTLVGVFYGLYVPRIPVLIIKFAVLNHWRGEGQYMSEVRILSPDRTQAIAVSRPTTFRIQPNGFADNINIFANVTFPVEGDYWVQTLVDSRLFSEWTLPVGVIGQKQPGEEAVADRVIH